MSGNGAIGGEDFNGIISQLGNSRRPKTSEAGQIEPVQLMSEEEPYVTVLFWGGDERGVVLEGGDGSAMAVSLGLSQMLPYDVTVDFTIEGITATAGDDFELLPGGMLTGTITVIAQAARDPFKRPIQLPVRALHDPPFLKMGLLEERQWSRA